MSKNNNDGPKFKIESISIYLLAIFYLISSGFFFFSLTMDLNMIHIGLLGLLSLTTALGVFKRKSWSVWSAFLVFCAGNAFAISLLLNPLTFETLGVLVEIGLIVYLILVWAAMIYLSVKRREFY
ncbi:MAG: hypothetical protein DRJ47_11030 [Thermoprotei archaeon]|nr:MAG: hypothetical protein DRJ47_11030 [Thermoprotei archaeon]